MTETNLKDLLDAMDDAVHVVDKDLRIKFFNKSFRKWNKELKLPHIDVIGKNIFELFPFLSHKEESEYREVFMTGRKLVTEGHLDIDGQEFYVVTQKIPLIKDGDIVQIITIVRDVTSTKKAASKLLESEILFRGAVENANDAIYIITLRGFEFVNHAFEQLTGYTTDEVTDEDFNFLKLIHPEDHAMIKKREQARQGGEDISNRYEFRIIDKKEMVKIVEVTTVALKGKDQPRVMGILRDITERVRMENDLQEAINKHSALLKALPDMMFILDRKGIFMDFYSPSIEHLAIPPNEIIGKNINNAGFTEEQIQQIMNSIATALDVGTIQEVEYELKTAAGNGVYNARIAPLSEDKVLAIVRDITGIKESEERIKGVNDVLRLINKIMRHDILNDIQVARGALELYENEPDEKILKKIGSRLNQSVALIHRMKGLEALVETGKELEPYPVRNIVKEILDNYDIDFSIEGDCVAPIDQAFISVIDNLIENAVVHGETNRIEVTLEDQQDGHCKIRIADYGKGISDTIKNRVFEEQFSAGMKAGSGLGLFIVRKTIERYGGTIYIEDNHPSGAVITIQLCKSPMKQ